MSARSRRTDRCIEDGGPSSENCRPRGDSFGGYRPEPIYPPGLTCAVITLWHLINVSRGCNRHLARHACLLHAVRTWNILWSIVRSMHRHVEVYIDESGDLGFSTSSTKHLVMVALATSAPHELSRIVRKARRRFSQSDGAGSEFKFNRSGGPMRRFFLEQLARTESWIVWCSVLKSETLHEGFVDGESLWLHAACSTVSRIARLTHAKSVHLKVDRYSTRPNTDWILVETLRNVAERDYPGYFPPSVKVSLVDSLTSEGLQVADYVAGAVFHSVERGDPSYLEIITEIVLRGGPLK